MRTCLLLFCLLLGACVAPIVNKDVGVVEITYSQALQVLNSKEDVLVRWGGIIIEVQNEEKFSILQVKFYPLNYLGRPQIDKLSEGHFVIKGAEFPNPVVYAENMEITVVGTLKGNIERTVDGEIVRVPLILLSSLTKKSISQSVAYPYIWDSYEQATGDEMLTETVGMLRDLAISPYLFLYYVCCTWWDKQVDNEYL
jgi:outer membrane lipoprotein